MMRKWFVLKGVQGNFVAMPKEYINGRKVYASFRAPDFYSAVRIKNSMVKEMDI